MNTESHGGDDSRPRTRRWAWLQAVKFYLLAGLVCGLLFFIVHTRVVHVAFLRLAWWLGPRPSFPFPYESRLSPPFSGIEATVLDELVGIVLIAVFSIIPLFIVHSVSFATAVGLHAFLARPRYWRDVRPKLDLGLAWVTSVRRSWWLWPVGQAVWLFLENIGLGFQSAFYPIVDTGLPFLLLHNFAIGLGFVVISSRVLRSFVVEAIECDDLRCGQCGYLLRGIESERCPECGHKRNGVEYELWRPRPSRRSRVRSFVPWLIILFLFLAPVWVPGGLSRLPASWLQHVPEAIRPDWQVLRQDFDYLFPIRNNAVCVIEHEDAIAIIWFEQARPYQADYQVAFWSDVEDMRLAKPPDRQSLGQLTNGCGPVPVGPWKFSYEVAGGDTFWMWRPDLSFSVQAFEKDSLPQQYQAGMAALDGQHMEPPMGREESGRE